MHEKLVAAANKLASGETTVLHIKKEETANFFEIIRNRDDFKHFRGTAEKGGSVSYQYTEHPRS